ncbi:hypothetical protein OH77DRAFT_678324 [Trametes cingulata]|nr:hypothetical protein OH77DRAFT_678324 [Trametes cingulata]
MEPPHDPRARGSTSQSHRRAEQSRDPVEQQPGSQVSGGVCALIYIAAPPAPRFVPLPSQSKQGERIWGAPRQSATSPTRLPRACLAAGVRLVEQGCFSAARQRCYRTPVRPIAARCEFTGLVRARRGGSSDSEGGWTSWWCKASESLVGGLARFCQRQRLADKPPRARHRADRGRSVPRERRRPRARTDARHLWRARRHRRRRRLADDAQHGGRRQRGVDLEKSALRW